MNAVYKGVRKQISAGEDDTFTDGTPIEWGSAELIVNPTDAEWFAAKPERDEQPQPGALAAEVNRWGFATVARERLNRELDDNSPTSPASQRWMRSAMAAVKPNGLWGVPRSGSVYQIDHEAQLATLVAGPGEDCIAEAFHAIGWRVG